MGDRDGSVTVRGTLSVEKIPAGMGVVPAGTVVPVYGTGFTTSTTVLRLTRMAV